MIFFLDENFPKIAVSLLRSKGHSVYDIRGTDFEGSSDIDIFLMSKKNQAIFLTTDRDFHHTIHYNEKPHFGIVVIILSKPNSNNIITKLKWFIDAFPDNDKSDTCFVIFDRKCNIYK